MESSLVTSLARWMGMLPSEYTHIRLVWEAVPDGWERVLLFGVALANSDTSGAVATLFEAAKRLKPREADRSLARQALEVLRATDAGQRDQLEKRFRAVLR